MYVSDAINSLIISYIGNTFYKQTLVEEPIPPTEIATVSEPEVGIKPDDYVPYDTYKCYRYASGQSILDVNGRLVFPTDSADFELYKSLFLSQQYNDYLKLRKLYEEFLAYPGLKAQYDKDLLLYRQSANNRAALITILNRAAIEVFSRFELKFNTLVFNYAVGEVIDLPIDWVKIAKATAIKKDAEGNITQRSQIKVSPKYLDDLVYLHQSSPFKLEVLSNTNQVFDFSEVVVEYAAAPNKLEAVHDFLDIPVVLENILLIYAAYLVQTSISGDITNENNTYYLRYEAESRKIERADRVSSVEVTGDIKAAYSGMSRIA